MRRPSRKQEKTTRDRALAWAGMLVLMTGLLGGPSTGRAEIIDRIVARVNDEVITKRDVEQAVTPFLLQRGLQPSVLDDPERRREIHRKVLDQLIERQLIRAEADKLDLSINDEQVDQWMSMTRRKQGMSEQQFRNLVEEYGMSYERYRNSVRMNLLKIRLVKVKLGRQVSVSDEKVDEVYREQYGDQGSKRTQVTLRQILFQPDSDGKSDVEAARKRAHKVLRKLEKGKSFEELAKTFSDGPAAEKGGMLGTFTEQELNPEFRDAALELDEGEHSDVIRTKFGFHVFRVDRIEQKGSADVEKRKKMIRQKLRQQNLQKQLESYVSDLRKKAFVDVKMEM